MANTRGPIKINKGPVNYLFWAFFQLKIWVKMQNRKQFKKKIVSQYI